MKINEFEKRIGYEFKDKNLLDMALTHCSFNRERNTKHVDNERLEFLGDALLDAIVSIELFKKMANWAEGKLTKIRAIVVCEKSLADIARKLDLGSFVNMGYGEDHAGGRAKDSIIADCVEAIIGALYIDGGYEAARNFVLNNFSNTIELAIEGKLFKDYKSEVQELLQENGTVEISYVTDREEGPDHDKTFFVHMECNGIVYGRGSGKSKKEAGQAAAEASIKILKENK